MEPEVKYTTKICQFIKDSLETDSSLANVETKKYVENHSAYHNIPFRIIKNVYNRNKEKGKEQPYLNEILQDSDLHLPAIVSPPKDPEYEARIKRLKAEQANREYKEMTRNVDKKQQQLGGTGLTDLNIGRELKQINRYIWVIINFVFTVVAAFAFGYKATEIAFQRYPNTFGLQMVVGLVFGTVVFFADLWFVVRETG